MKVGILNVTGYAGVELVRLLHNHPGIQLISISGRSAAGQNLADVFPHLADIDLPIQAELSDVELVFSALPHGASASAILPLLRLGARIVDISADFRLNDPGEYQRWYGIQHPAPELLPEAVYGLTELNRAQVPAARIVANPGCYPTSAILALAPVFKEGLIQPDIIIDSKSGISGAGRSLGLTYHFSEANENVSAYALDGHRHLPEMVQEFAKLGTEGRPAVTFLPHLIPMTRGILSSCYARFVDGKIPATEQGRQQIRALYRDFYREEPFVRVVDKPPQTKHTLGNNLCIIYPTVDLHTGRLLVISCLDNLVKGAAGQAIQNMNLMLGFPETMGLEGLAVYP